MERIHPPRHIVNGTVSLRASGLYVCVNEVHVSIDRCSSTVADVRGNPVN